MQTPRSPTPATNAVNTDVLVLGGGFAGTRCAQRLERLLPRDCTIKLVSSENYFVFQPLLPEVVGASLDPAHVISPLRHMLRRTQVVRGEVSQIELAPAGAEHAGTVTVRADGVAHPVVLTARHIVLALGSVVDVSRIPGMAEQALMMKNVADALALRHAIIHRLECAVLEPDPAERQALLTFVVVGGGFSGIETAAEMHDLVHGAMKFFPTFAAEAKRVVCVHSRERILPELDARLGDYALRLLQKRGIEFRLEERTRAASRDGVYLGNGDFIAARTIVCTIGNAPHPILEGVAAAVEGRLPTTEHLRLQDAERAREVAEQANRAKSEFLSRMSHELRTPLNAILGFAQLLELDLRHPLTDAQRPWVAQIQSAGWHLLEMINDVLDLSRIEAGTMRLQPETLALGPLIAATLALIEGTAERRGIVLTQHIDDGATRVHGDATRVKQILTNLLSNAAKYNHYDGRIHIMSLAPGDDQVEITVTAPALARTGEQIHSRSQHSTRLAR